jgi:hypothetical protein
MGGEHRDSVNRRRLLYGGAAAALGGAGVAAWAGGAWNAPAAGAASGDHPGYADVVADFGARGDGRTDDSAAFRAAYAYAEQRAADGTGRTVVLVPPGRYLVTQPGALIDADQPDHQRNGLRFVGGGLRITDIVFTPEAVDADGGTYLCRNNDTWQNVSFEGMRFTSGTPGASFFSSYSTGGAANYRFSECEWMGEWTYGLALDGTNDNSEMRWEACRVGGAYREAFLYSGLSRRSTDPDQQDQFLNYWFTDMNVTYEWGDFLAFPYGGSITCRSGSYIVTGRRPTAHPERGFESAFFRFPRASHFDGVQRFHAEDIRFELRDDAVVVIDCAWNRGTVHFNDCDDTAHAFRTFSDGLRAHRYTLTGNGPLVRYDSCQLVGTHLYRGAQGAAPPVCVRYDMCRLASHPRARFLAIDGPGGTDFARFVDCVPAG